MVKRTKTYAEYLAESKPITNHLMPSFAVPKFQKRNSPKDNFEGRNSKNRLITFKEEKKK